MCVGNDEALRSLEINQTKADRRKKLERLLTIAAFTFIAAMIFCSPELTAFAAGESAGGSGAAGAAGGTIASGFTNLLDIVKSLVSSIGTIVLLWGFFEWGTSMQSQDGVMQSSAFKRIGGGLVMVLAPQLISVFAQ